MIPFQIDAQEPRQIQIVARHLVVLAFHEHGQISHLDAAIETGQPDVALFIAGCHDDLVDLPANEEVRNLGRRG